jgi:low affinity Fe/Cu permease
MANRGRAGDESDSSGSRLSRVFTSFASAVSHAAGNPITFVVCCLAIIIWMASGPVFGFSDTWQLVINTGTTIVTFLMVFLIQNTQNRDNAALQAKLDEIIRAVSDANNHFIGIEHLTAEELEQIRKAVEDDARDQGDGPARELRSRKIDQTFARLSKVSSRKA